MGDELPFWLNPLLFAEDGDDDSGDDESQDDDADDDDGDEDDDDTGKKGKDEDDPTAGLKSALKKERTERKRLEKEAKKLRAAQQKIADKDKSETDQSKDEAREATEKAARLAAKLQTNAVDTAILRAASSFTVDGKKFTDIDDAISLVKRSEIEVEQDEDDPSDIEVDSDSVVTALKALAKRKPHLLSGASKDDDEGDDDDEDVRPSRRSTGSKVGSRGTRDKGKIKEDELRRQYPMLAGRG